MLISYDYRQMCMLGWDLNNDLDLKVQTPNVYQTDLSFLKKQNKIVTR